MHDELMKREEQIGAAIAQLRSYGAVAVLGAGLSAPRYPMTGQLPALLWHAIDSNPEARADLAKRIGKTNAPSKKLLGDSDALLEAWRLVETNPSVRRAFQQAFSRLDLDREPTPAHYALARLIHGGIVEYTISFNWDTALERAHEQLFGTTLAGKADLLTKPHGDALHPEQDWVLPHQPGEVPSEVLRRISELSSERPRSLLVVGYSGSDQEIVDQLLDPVEGRWPVVRIGPPVSGPETVTGTADDVIPEIANRMDAPVDMIGWRWVSFTRSRDIRAALMGYRLGPQDVEACPELPAVPRVAQRLTQTGLAVVTGDSGTGKSITAFQTAHKLHADGWRVVELSEPGVASEEFVRTFTSLTGPILAVVDDAQALDPSVVQSFERSVSADHAVLLVATDRMPGQERVRIVGKQAVDSLAQYCDQQADALLPLVAEIDDRVGYGMGKEPLPRRLKAAAESEYPWQFMYVLSGGERRISEALADVADENAGDLLFGLVAATQLLSLDAGVSRDKLVEHARSIGRDEEWLDTGLATLTANRLIVRRGDLIRTAHMRIADRGLLALCRDSSNPVWHDLLAFLRSRLLDRAEPMQGRLWMLRAIDQADPLRYGRPALVLDKEVALSLLDECLEISAGRDRSIAAYLLWEVEWWRALDSEMAEKVAGTLPLWISEMTSDDVFGIQWIFGGLRSNFADLHKGVCQQVEPELVADRFINFASPAAGDSWGRLISEFSQATDFNKEGWASRFEAAIDYDRIPEITRRDQDQYSLWGNAELASDLAFFAPRVSAAIVRAITPSLRNRLEADIARAASETHGWAFSIFMLAQVEPDTEGAEVYRPLREAVTELVETTDWESAGRSLAAAELHETDNIDLLTFSVERLAPEAIKRMTSSVPLEELDRVTAGQWRDLKKIQHLVVSLGLGENREPARTWVSRHADEIEQMPTRVIPIAPQVTADLVHRGGAVKLEVQNGIRWGWCAEALQSLVAVDQPAARKVVENSMEDIIKGLELRQANMVEDLEEFVAAVDAIDPALIEELLAGLDPQVAQKNWSDRLQGTPQEAAATGVLVNRARQGSGSIKEVADQLAGNRGT